MSKSKSAAMGASAAFTRATGARSERSQAYARATGQNTEPQGNITLELDLDKIADNPENPRGVIDTADEEFLQLVSSIREIGVTSPISVCHAAAFLAHHEQHRDAIGSAEYVLLAGHRRVTAAPLAGRTSVPAQIDDKGAENPLVWALAENGLRVGLNPIQQAQTLKKLTDKPPQGRGLSQGQVAKSIGRSQPYISQLKLLLDLVPELQTLVARGELIQRDARDIARKPQAEQMAAYEALLQPASVSEPATVTHNPVMGQSAPPDPDITPSAPLGQPSAPEQPAAPQGDAHNPVMAAESATPVATAEPDLAVDAASGGETVPVPSQSTGRSAQHEDTSGIPWHDAELFLPHLKLNMPPKQRKRLASLLLKDNSTSPE